MIKTIKEEAFEYASIAMDNEDLSDEMLDRLLADDEACRRWHEYHLIRDCMKRHVTGREVDFMQSSLFTQTLAEISQEHQARHAAQSSKVKVKPPQAANHTFKGFAVAASLAAVAVSIWQFWPQIQEPQSVSVAAEEARIDNEHIVPVRAEPQSKAASETVLPNAAKQLPSQQNMVRVASQVEQQQEVVQ